MQHQYDFANSYLGSKYEQESKSAKAVGYVLLEVGVFTILAGASTISSNIYLSSPDSEVASGVGAIMALGSIPVFIIANKNKRKARRILKNQKSF